MYRVDKRTHRHRRARRRGFVLLVVVLVVGSIYVLLHIRVTPKQQLRNAPSVSTRYTTQADSKVSVSKPLFAMELPYGWTELTTNVGSTAPTYSFRSISQEARLLDIYIDNVPANMALNRAIAVTQQGSSLAYDTVSENCTTFTDPTKANVVTGNVAARWQGIDFMCDIGNYARAVVGSVSKAGPNQIDITSRSGAAHKIFITYTDNNISPDYSVLYTILRSFQIK